MTHRTNAQKVLEAIAKQPGLDDDELSLSADIFPRQTINQTCHKLEKQGLIMRKIGVRGKIINYLNSPYSPQNLIHESRENETQTNSINEVSIDVSQLQKKTIDADLATTLFIIPCSKKKDTALKRNIHGPSILDILPPNLAERLANARKANFAQASINETFMIPAWQRYCGALYTSAKTSLEKATAADSHILILSGGYGVVLATEPIGTYEAVFKRSWWPTGLIEEIISFYASYNELKKVRAIVSASTDYRKIVERVDWRMANVLDGLLLTPERTRGATRKAPVTQGEALTALLDGKLFDGWVSSYGLSLNQFDLLPQTYSGN